MIHNKTTFLKSITLCCLLFYTCFIVGQERDSLQPPVEKGMFIPSDLVELIQLDATFQLDIKYATSNNFIGKPVYKEARAFLQRPAALALVQAQKDFKELGYGLIIFDGYRPWSVTKEFWDLTPAHQKHFVADPKKGSRHNRGCAIDVSLYDLVTGKTITMTSDYDEMTSKSYPNYKGGTEEQTKARDLLILIMEAHGFTVYPYEWWHFDYKEWKYYHIENIPFSEID